MKTAFSMLDPTSLTAYAEELERLWSEHNEGENFSLGLSRCTQIPEYVLQMFAVWGNPNEGASEILQKFPAGMDSGWHWHTAAYQGVVIQGRFTHTFKGAAPQTGRPGSVWSQPAGQVHNDKCEEGGDCIVLVYFHGKLDFMPVNMKAQ